MDESLLGHIRTSLKAATLMAIASSGIVVNAHAQVIPQATVRDSLGIKIVEYATIKTNLQAFRITSTIATVGGLRDDPAEEIEYRTGIESSQRLSNGNIAAAEWSAVRIVAPKGRFVRMVGAKGSGEWLSPRVLGRTVATS